MAAIIEVKYFKSFVLKKSATAASTTTKPVWNGSFGIPESIGGFPAYDDVSNPIENDTRPPTVQLLLEPLLLRLIMTKLYLQRRFINGRTDIHLLIN